MALLHFLWKPRERTSRRRPVVDGGRWESKLKTTQSASYELYVQLMRFRAVLLVDLPVSRWTLPLGN
jgi:hypothetical protein